LPVSVLSDGAPKKYENVLNAVRPARSFASFFARYAFPRG